MTSWTRPAWPPRRWAARVAWALWGLTLLSLPVGIWLNQLLRRAGLAELSSLQAANLLWILAGVTAATVGAVLASRRPAHPVGWLLLIVGVSEQFTNLVGDYVHYGVMGRPGGLPAASYLSGFYNSGTVVIVACIGFIALLTPTGSLPSPRWRWWTSIVVAALVMLLVSAALDPHPLVPEDPTFENPLAAPPAAVDLLAVTAAASAAILLVGLVVAAGSLVVRYRRARGIERQQLRWLALAAAVSAVALLVAVAAAVRGWSLGVVLAAAGTSVVLLPLAGPVWCCRPWPPGRRSCATGSMTWTASSAAPWPTGCSPSCSGWATRPSSSGLVGSSPRAPAWWWRRRLWPWPPPSSRPADGSSRMWTGASTAAATTPAGSSRPSGPGYGTRWIWTP